LQKKGDNGLGDEPKPSDIARKLAIVKQSFDYSSDLTHYEDAKAGQILAPMAFLTAAYAAIWGSFFSKSVTFTYHSYDLVTISFVGYVACVTIGTVFVLDAFGPRFNIPKLWKSKAEEPSSNIPKSIFFFELIAKEPMKKWRNYFSNSADVVEQKALDDLIYETHLVSEKIAIKIRSIKRGKFFFLLSMAFLIVGTSLGAFSFLFHWS
jgi:hypothetical protein